MLFFTFDGVISFLEKKIFIIFVLRSQSQWSCLIPGVSASPPSLIDLAEVLHFVEKLIILTVMV